ncbi:hypothetical protein [Streptomyces erythrochromogenes]|uniref:hypothetical protein n=1 Tax=Streptomyces erythrochromogenes TaxID=285574 RepID=UPI003802D131
MTCSVSMVPEGCGTESVPFPGTRCVAIGGAALRVQSGRGVLALPEGTGPRILWGLLPAPAFVGPADVAANGTYSVAALAGTAQPAAARSGPVTMAPYRPRPTW